MVRFSHSVAAKVGKEAVTGAYSVEHWLQGTAWSSMGAASYGTVLVLTEL